MKSLATLSLVLFLGSGLASAKALPHPQGSCNGCWNRGRPMIHRLMTNEAFRKKLEAKMSPADAATFETTISDMKSEMAIMKPLHEQIKSAHITHDTVAARAALAEAIPHFMSFLSDRKVIRDLLLRYKANQNASLAPAGTNLTVAPLYPNPFHAGAGGTASLHYTIENGGHVHVALIDGHGNLIRDLADEDQSGGEHSVPIPTSGLRPGAYMLQVQTGGESKTTKLIVIQ